MCIRDSAHRARLLLLQVLARSAVLTAQPQADRAVAAWFDLAQRRFPHEAWRPRLVAAQQLVDLGRWDEADALLATLADAVPPAGAGDSAEAQATARIEAERLRAALDRGDTQRAFALAIEPRSAADASGRAEALCTAGSAHEGLALLDAQARAAAGWRYPSSPDIAREQAVRGQCALASGDVKAAAGFERRACETWAGQPGVSPALARPLERLEAKLRA